MPDLITPELVTLDADLGADKKDVVAGLAQLLAGTERCNDVDTLVADAMAREERGATGLPGGIAIPHCRSEAVLAPSLAFAQLDKPVDFGAKDGPADIVFLIATPADSGSTHLELLTQLARALVKRGFSNSVRGAETPQQVVEAVARVVKLP